MPEGHKPREQLGERAHLEKAQAIFAEVVRSWIWREHGNSSTFEVTLSKYNRMAFFCPACRRIFASAPKKRPSTA